MARGIWASTAFLFFFAFVAMARAAGEPTCDVPMLKDLILGIVGPDSCPIGVVEGGEKALQRALRIVHDNKNEYTAVLFYASWCPFSKLCRPIFRTLSTLFPRIRHFAFEESVIRPSMLSRYGVRGFPTLFLMNSTMRVRYQGSRSINSLITFYTEITGIKPESTYLKPMDENLGLRDFGGVEQSSEPENCPFSWAKSPEKLLQEDTYLALATSFVLMRLLYFLLPMLHVSIRQAWRRHVRYPSLMALWERSGAYFEQTKQGIWQLIPCKRHNLQEGALNARAWASKSLASVSLGEPSSGRTNPLS